MSAEFPNRFRTHRGEYGGHGTFGNFCSVQAIHIQRGLGHQPHFAAHFEGGLELDLTPDALLTFVRAAQAALAKLPIKSEDVSDYVGGGEQ